MIQRVRGWWRDFEYGERRFVVVLAIMLALFAAVFVATCREESRRDAWCAAHPQDMRCAGRWQ